VLKTMTFYSPKAQISGGDAAVFNALMTTRSTLSLSALQLVA